MKRFLTLLLLLLPLALLADNVTEQRAKELATQFLQSSPGSRAGSISLEMVFNGMELDSRSSSTTPPFYVFNNRSGKGFVIVAGDDAVMPVLGYSTEWNFASNPVPYNVKGWLEGMSRQINYVREAEMAPSQSVQKAWKEVATRGAASRTVSYETAIWNQTEPFNGECPMEGKERTVTGCVATAMAIVMKYHAWPDSGVGTIPGYGSVSARPLGDAYDWSSMPLQYEASASAESKSQVARLMADCGAMVQAEYGVGGTAAVVANIPSAIIQYMKYSADTRYKQRDSYSATSWHKMLQESLDANGPIIYGGQGFKGGHAFVLDGYNSDNSYHVNWGWGGFCNGNFTLGAMNPSDNGTSQGDFNTQQEAIIGMTKSTGETMTEEMEFVKTGDTSVPFGLSTNPALPKKGVEFVVSWNTIINSGLVDISGITFLLALTDASGSIKEELQYINGDNLPARANFGIFTFPATITQEIAKGDRIRMFFKSSKTTSWKLIKSADPTEVPWEIVLEEPEEEVINLGKDISFNFDKTAKLITFGLKDGISVKLMSPSNADITGNCQVSGGQCKVSTESLETGDYEFIFEKGGKTLSLKVTL